MVGLKKLRCQSPSISIDVIGAAPVGAVVLLLAVLMVPLLWTLGRLQARLTIGMESALGPLALVALCWGVVWFVVAAAAPEWHDVVLAVLGGVLGTVGMVRVISLWGTQPRIQLCAIGADLAIFPRWAVAIGMLALAREVDPAVVLGPAAWLILRRDRPRRIREKARPVESTEPGAARSAQVAAPRQCGEDLEPADRGEFPVGAPQGAGL